MLRSSPVTGYYHGCGQDRPITGKPAIEISVSDTGIGIDPADRAQDLPGILSGAGRAYGQDSGTGYSLAPPGDLSSSMEAGSASKAEKVKGSRFHLQLRPSALWQCKTPALQRLLQVNSGYNIMKGTMDNTILIVENDAKNMKLFRDLLQANGFFTLLERPMANKGSKSRS